MTYKSLLAWVDNSPRSEATLDVAVRLASAFGAHLRVVHLRDSVPAQVLATDPRAEIYTGALFNDVAERNDKRAAELEAALRDRATAVGLAGADWLTTGNTVLDHLVTAARYADLCVMGQSGDEQYDAVFAYPSNFPASLALSSGRPLLILPRTGRFEAIGRHVVVAWNGSREAARAVSDALPFLEKARQVTVLIGGSAPSREVDGSASADIEAYFSYRGIRATVEQRPLADVSATDLLLSRAAELDADLLVMGAYGHSRVRELVLGGVSRDILQRMTLPVLMSH